MNTILAPVIGHPQMIAKGVSNMDNRAEKPDILVVDGSPENVAVLSALLDSEYRVRVAPSGKQALNIVEADHPPDLILLDVVGPEIDGYEVCKRLKADPRTCDIPIIFLTARDSEADVTQGLAAGAVDYIAKPFSPAILKARTKAHLALKKYRDAVTDSNYTDGLTAIANRCRFDEYFTAMWHLAARESLPLSLIMIDIDDFNQFNENYGHQEGDACLVRIARLLTGSTTWQTDLLARYGGDEFMYVLPDTQVNDAIQLADGFRRQVLSLQIPHAFSTTGNQLTISLGVATAFSARDSSPQALIQKADEALYQAKVYGKNRVHSESIVIR